MLHTLHSAGGRGGHGASFLPSPPLPQQPHPQEISPRGQGESGRKRSREDPAEDSEAESVELKVDDEDESLPPSPAASSGGQPSRHKVERPGTPNSSRSGGSSSVSGSRRGTGGEGRGEGEGRRKEGRRGKGRGGEGRGGEEKGVEGRREKGRGGEGRRGEGRGGREVRTCSFTYHSQEKAALIPNGVVPTSSTVTVNGPTMSGPMAVPGMRPMLSERVHLSLLSLCPV